MSSSGIRSLSLTRISPVKQFIKQVHESVKTRSYCKKEKENDALRKGILLKHSSHTTSNPILMNECILNLVYVASSMLIVNYTRNMYTCYLYECLYSYCGLSLCTAFFTICLRSVSFEDLLRT